MPATANLDHLSHTVMQLKSKIQMKICESLPSGPASGPLVMSDISEVTRNNLQLTVVVGGGGVAGVVPGRAGNV